jgi:glycosyltransferase involved in cell wall biosynthesis
MKHTLRRVVQRTAEQDQRLQRTVRKAAVALVTTASTAERVRHLGAADVMIFPSVSLSENDFRKLSAIPIRLDSPPRLFSLGRLLHWKGFDLGIEAFSRIAREFPDAEYWIIGDGIERGRLERRVMDLNLEDRVTFLGHRQRDDALEDLASCDILVHPSMHDSGGWVTLEAMAAGRPIVCLDAGGPAMQVIDHETGFKIKPGQRATVVEDLAGALRKLLADAQLRVRLGTSARAFVYQNYHAETGRRIKAIYGAVLDGAAASERFVRPEGADQWLRGFGGITESGGF